MIFVRAIGKIFIGILFWRLRLKLPFISFVLTLDAHCQGGQFVFVVFSDLTMYEKLLKTTQDKQGV